MRHSQRNYVMKYKLFVLSVLALTLSSCAARQTAGQTPPQPRQPPTLRTIFIPAMNGYETNVASAIKAADVPVDIIAEKTRADLQVRPTFSDSGGIADVLYEKRTGHAPFSYLDVVDLETNHVLLSYPFLWSDHEDTRSKDAQEFARELKNKLAKAK
jgi:hypothetical protein